MALCDECIKKEICNVSKFFTGNYGNGLPLAHCKHFIGKAPREIKTNFQRITASPEALAEFINKAEETYERCCKGDIRCDFCDCQWCGIAGRSELVEWLKQESE